MSDAETFLRWWVSAFDAGQVNTLARLRHSLKGIALDDMPDHRRDMYVSFRKCNQVRRAVLLARVNYSLFC